MLSTLFEGFKKNSQKTDELLVGQKINQDLVVQSLIDDLVDEVMVYNNEIQSIQKPNQKYIHSNKAKIDRTGVVRGRPLYHNYIGTGAGRGPYVELEDGSVKLDLINGIGIHIMGHSHPRIIKASVRGALADIVMQGNLQPNNEYLQLSEKLVQIAGRKSRLKHVWFATCGTMANENALKLARQKIHQQKWF